MTDAFEDPFSSAIVWDTDLSIAWEPGTLPDKPGLERLNIENIALLSALAVFEEKPLAVHEEHTPLGQELQRLDTKMDLLVSLLGQLITSTQDLPGSRPVIFSAVAARLHDWEIADGESGCLAFSPSSSVPGMLIFPAMAERGFLRFTGFENELQSEWEKLLFRRHRRSVARNRQQ